MAGPFAEALQRGFIELAELLHQLVRALHFVSHAVSAKVSSIKLHIKHMFRNNACRTCVAGILLPHNESRLRLVTYLCHWTKAREADVVAYIRIGEMAWAVDFR